YHLRNLAKVGREVELEVSAPVTQRAVLDALEARYPMLRGTIRDHDTQRRRPFLRFFACERDLSNESPDAPLPEAVVTGAEPYFVIGAIAGGGASAKPEARGVGSSGEGGSYMRLLRSAAFLLVGASTAAMAAFAAAPAGLQGDWQTVIASPKRPWI